MKESLENIRLILNELKMDMRFQLRELETELAKVKDNSSAIYDLQQEVLDILKTKEVVE